MRLRSRAGAQRAGAVDQMNDVVNGAVDADGTGAHWWCRIDRTDARDAPGQRRPRQNDPTVSVSAFDVVTASSCMAASNSNGST